MGAFGSVSLGTKFSIVLCSLVGLSFIAGLVKLWINKRRLKKHIKLEEEQSAGKSQDTEKLVGRQLDEGDLFGVRAIQHGYFGGVAQSRPSSPVQSRPHLPTAPLPNGEELGKSHVQHGVTDLRQHQNTTIPVPTSSQPVKMRPSPLQLQPSDAALPGRRAHRESGPRPRSAKSLSPSPSPKLEVYAPTSVVSPVTESLPANVHSEPASQSNIKRPKSYLPKLGFENNGVMTSSLLGTIRRKKPDLTAISGDDVLSTVSVERADHRSAKYSTFPSPPALSQAPRQSERSIFPRDDDMDRPTSRRSGKSINLADIPIPPIPMADDPSGFSVKGSDFSERQEHSSHRYGVSGNQPTRSRSASQDTTEVKRNRASSVSLSSVYSVATPTIDHAPEDVSSAQQQVRIRTNSDSPQREGRSRHVSQSHRRQSSSKSLSQTRDSLKQQRRKVSEDHQAAMKARSTYENEIVDDSASHHRSHNGSNTTSRAAGPSFQHWNRLENSEDSSYYSENTTHRASRSQSREPLASDSTRGLASTGRPAPPPRAKSGSFMAGETVLEMPIPLPAAAFREKYRSATRIG